MQESASFGNIFVSPRLGRIGANQSGSPYTDPFGTNALCRSSCARTGLHHGDIETFKLTLAA